MPKKPTRVPMIPDPDDRAEVIDLVLTYAEENMVAINAALPKVNPEIEKRFGVTIKPGWFEKWCARDKGFAKRRQDLWRAMVCHIHEAQDALEDEFASKIFKTKKVTTVTRDGHIVEIEKPVLQREDIDAFKVLSFTRRQRVAQMMPGVFAPTQKQVDDAIRSAFSVNLGMPPPPEEDEEGGK